MSERRPPERPFELFAAVALAVLLVLFTRAFANLRLEVVELRQVVEELVEDLGHE